MDDVRWVCIDGCYTTCMRFDSIRFVMALVACFFVRFSGLGVLRGSWMGV